MVSPATAAPSRRVIGRFLHPAKLRDGLRRRWFELGIRHIPVDAYPGRLQKLGSDYGGWTVPASEIDETWTCYCVGAGADVTFDMMLLEHAARVRTIDPFAVFGEQARQAAGDDPRFSFHEFAVAAADGPLRMYGWQDDEKGSLSAANIYKTDAWFEKPGRTVASIAAELGDERVDLLKLDIEGSEYDVLDNLDPRALGVRVICVELHHAASVRRARRTVERLRRFGFHLVHREGPADLTFIRSD